MATQSHVHVFLQSDVYGCETFSYSNDDEAIAALHRLAAQSRSAIDNDGIERIIGIIVSERPDGVRPSTSRYWD